LERTPALLVFILVRETIVETAIVSHELNTKINATYSFLGYSWRHGRHINFRETRYGETVAEFHVVQTDGSIQQKEIK
jgi:hypothetical protein